jgi:N-acetylmuramoyl-L-alanine amidase
MSKAWQWALWVMFLVAISGCESPSPTHYQTPLKPGTTSTVTNTAHPSVTNPPLTSVTISNEMEIAPPTPLTPPPKQEKKGFAWPTNWVNVWIPLESWGKYNNLEKYRVVASNPHPYYQFLTERGAISLKVGTRVAYLNGLECWLGFAPQVFNGIPCVHWLDAKKVLQPLLQPFQLPADPGTGLIKTSGTIVIDAGHGGGDGGAKNMYNSHNEKEYTLDCALRLGRILQTNGWRVVFTRMNDIEVSLSERVAIANRANADLFISLHFNSGDANHDLNGIETYCLTPTGMPSNLVRNNEDDVELSFPNNAYDEQNIQLGARLHRAIVLTSEANDRGLRHARFMSVLRGQNRPAVLIEGGYMSNPTEARKIASADYREKLAIAIAEGLK